MKLASSYTSSSKEKVTTSQKVLKDLGLFLRKTVLPYFAAIILFCLAFNYLFEEFIIFRGQVSGGAKINRIITVTDQDEIPIIGSSRAQESFVPSMISDKCYNYGLNGTKFRTHNIFLTEELKKDKTTPIIINYDYDGFDNGGGNNQGLGNINNYIPDALQPSVKLALDDKFSTLYYFPTLKYYGAIEEYIKFFLNERMEVTKVIDNGGSFEKNTLPKKKFDELIQQRLDTTYTFRFHSANHKRMIDLIKTHKERTFIFVAAPFHDSFIKTYTDISKPEQHLKELAKHKNVIVLDYSRDYYPDEMYMNTTHFNYKGAQEFSKKLRKDLIRLGVIE